MNEDDVVSFETEIPVLSMEEQIQADDTSVTETTETALVQIEADIVQLHADMQMLGASLLIAVAAIVGTLVALHIFDFRRKS